MPAKRSKPQHRVTKRTRSKPTAPKTQLPKMADTNPSAPVYFWRDSEPSTGYLSQWYPCAFSDDADPSIIYPTAEHYMMYQKALLFSDPDVAAKILLASHPREVKYLGRQVHNFSEPLWHAHREAIVRKGSLLKFTRPVDREDGWWVGQEGQDLKAMLLGTGERELVEASPMDRIWGIGFGEAKAGTVGRQKWGLNLLGKALMVVRGELREADAKEKGEGKEVERNVEKEGEKGVEEKEGEKGVEEKEGEKGVEEKEEEV